MTTETSPMKALKYLLFLVLIAIIGASVYFGTKDGSYDISVTKEMPVPAPMIYNKVNDLKQWPVWGPWSKNDPDMKVVFSDKTKGEGASYSWESEVEGDGTLTTDSLVENEAINQTIVFNTPIGDSESTVYWDFSPTQNGTTKVVWGMKGEQSFLEKVFMSFMDPPFEVSLKQMFEEGLENMNEILQEEMKEYNIHIEGVTEYGGGYYLYTTAASKTSELSERMGRMMGKVVMFAMDNNISISGMPFTIYNEWDELNGTAIYSVGMPVNERIIINEGDVLCGYMEPLVALKTVLKGNYTHLQEAYDRANAYIIEHNLVKDPSHDFFEIYANDPGEVPNPADWLTEIYIPVYRDLRANPTPTSLPE